MTKEEIIFKVAEEEFISNGYLSTSMVTSGAVAASVM